MRLSDEKRRGLATTLTNLHGLTEELNITVSPDYTLRLRPVINCDIVVNTEDNNNLTIRDGLESEKYV